jgi:hypothetical protein
VPKPITAQEAAARQQAKVDAYNARIAATKAKREAAEIAKTERDISRRLARGHSLDAAKLLAKRGDGLDWHEAARVLRLALAEVETYAGPERVMGGESEVRRAS